MTDWTEENLENKYYDWAVFKRILGYLRPYRALVAVSLLLLLAVSMLSLAGPLLTKVVIDDYIRVQQYEGLDQIAFIYIFVLVVGFVCQFFQYTLMQYIGQKVMFDLRTQVFAHLHKMSFRFFDRNPIGKITIIIYNEYLFHAAAPLISCFCNGNHNITDVP